jgi:hypothetical protein
MAVTIESGAAPAQQFSVPEPPVATSLIVVHWTGVNDVLQPLVIAVPSHAFATVSIDPTFVVSQ